MWISDTVSLKLLKNLFRNLDMSMCYCFFQACCKRPKTGQLKHFLLGSDIYFKSGGGAVKLKKKVTRWK